MARATQIDAAAFLARVLDPMTFYDLLPTDRIAVGSLPPLGPADDLARALLDRPFETVTAEALDRALLSCLASPNDWRTPDLAAVAEGASREYSRLLAGDKSDRHRRMRLQQLNYFCRDILSERAPTAATSTETTGAGVPNPWDWLPLAGAVAVISSGGRGVRLRSAASERWLDCGFASQLDVIDARRLSIGSIFSPGCHLLEDDRLDAIEHDQPVVLLFAQAGELLGVDYTGTIRRGGNGAAVGRLDTEHIDRARRVGDILFASDWSRPGVLYRHDLTTGAGGVVDLPGILILNDICLVGDVYYALCKQQGHVFKYDRTFRPLGRQLAFGRGEGRLFDPVAIRHDLGQLHVLNWVTGTKVSFPPF